MFFYLNKALTMATRSLKKIDAESKLIVDGFIRESQKLLPFEDNPYYNLNELIVHLCLMYYVMNEYWDILAAGFETEQDGTVLKRTPNEGWENANYGKKIVPSMGKYVYEWYFKINRLDYGYAYIGICDSKCDDIEEGIRWLDVDRYVYYGYRGIITGYANNKPHLDGLKYATENMVLMRLNTKMGTIEFYQSENEDAEMQLSGKMDILQEEELSYRMAVTVYNNKRCITLTKFAVNEA